MITFIENVLGHTVLDFHGTRIKIWSVVNTATEFTLALEDFSGKWSKMKHRIKKNYFSNEKRLKWAIKNEKKIQIWLNEALKVSAEQAMERLRIEEERKKIEALKKEREKRKKLIRSMVLEKMEGGKKKTVNIATQSYEVGIYIAISGLGAGLIQTGKPSKDSANRMLNKLEKQLNEQGYTTKAKEKVSDI